MSLMDKLRNAPSHQLGGTDKVFIDADTLQGPKGERYRIQGINAGEVEKVVDGKYKLGTAGGQVSTDVVSKLANEQGFVNVSPLFNPDGSPQMDTGGDRQLIDLTNDKGESFRTKLIEAGAFDINKHTTESDIIARDIAAARRNQEKLDGTYTADAFEEAAATIQQAELAEGDKLMGFKATALNEAQLAAAKVMGVGHLYADSNVQVRSYDRNLDNESLNPLSDAWDQGWQSTIESSWGVLNLVGDTTGSEWLEQIGEDGVSRVRARMGEKAKILTDYKDVDSFGTAAQFLGNNLALSIPYMAATVGATLAAPLTAGTSYAVPVALYTGQTWNEMEGEKNAAVAVGAGVAQATLDRIGLGGVLGGVKGKGSKEILNAGIAELVKRGATREAATQLVMNASRKELALLANESAKIARKQIEAKKVGKDLLKRFGVGGASEGLTEAGQEAIAYLGATYGSDKEFDWEELNERLIAGAVAGGALGGAFTVPATAYDVGAWKHAAHALSGADPTKASQSYQYSEQERAAKGYLPSIQENAAEARLAAQAQPSQFSLEERAAADADRRGRQGIGAEAWERVSNIQGLFQGSVANVIGADAQAKSRSARVLADMFGGNLQRIYGGSNYENTKHHAVTIYKNMVDMPQNIYGQLSGGKRVGNKQKAEISNTIYSQLNAAVDKDGNFNPEAIADGPNKAVLQKLGKDLNVLSNKMWQDQKKYNPELGYIPNYLFKYKAIDSRAVHKNKNGFQQALQKEYDLSPAEAKQITDQITDNPEVNDVDEAFSVVRGGNKPSSHKKRSLGISEREAFQEFVEKDLFANVSNAARQAARYTAHQEFIGNNAGIVSKLLDQMEAEGVSRQQVDKIAAGMKNYLDAESGNYKRPTSEAGKKAMKIQKNFMMFTALAGLPLATISSFVELALSNRALTTDQVFTNLKNIGKEGGKMFRDGFNEITDEALRRERDPKNISQSDGQKRLQDLGYYSWDVGAATTTGVTEVNKFQQHIFEQFFKWNGLQGWTNYTRAVRASMAGDYINDKLSLVKDSILSGEPKTRDVQDAEEALLNLGVDPQQLATIQMKVDGGLELNDQESKFLEDTYREASFNWVNDAVALPGAANRPLIYQDPRFALFTQFQGFMATFTANHIPRLWGEYVKRGSPAMKYNAFAVMATMIMLGFVSQYLKDLLKHGGENPYLDTPEYLQRGVRASGLLGTGERVLDLFVPLYGDQRTDGPADWLFTQTRSESPALSNIARLGKAGKRLTEGDVGEAARNTFKVTPLIAPFTSWSEAVGNYASGWNFKGDQ